MAAARRIEAGGQQRRPTEGAASTRLCGRGLEDGGLNAYTSFPGGPAPTGIARGQAEVVRRLIGSRGLSRRCGVGELPGGREFDGNKENRGR